MADDPYPSLTLEQAPDLQPGEIHLWLADLQGLAASVRDAGNILFPEEMERADRLKIANKRELFIIGRTLLRRLLGSYLGLPPASVRLSYGEHGKPSLAYGYPLEFNLSHTGSLAAVALLHRDPIGVDLERTDVTRDFSALCRRFFSAAEQRALEGLTGEDLRQGFYRIWCAKEAFIKATGLGLAQPLDHFSVPLDDGPVVQNSNPGNWSVRHLEAPPGYALTLAHTTENPVVRCFRLG